MALLRVLASTSSSCILVSCFPFIFWLIILMVVPDLSRTSVALLFDPDGWGSGHDGTSQLYLGLFAWFWRTSTGFLFLPMTDIISLAVASLHVGSWACIAWSGGWTIIRKTNGR